MKAALRLIGFAAVGCTAVAAFAALGPDPKPTSAAVMTPKPVAAVEKRSEPLTPRPAAEPSKIQAKIPAGPPPAPPLEEGPQRELRGGIYPTRAALPKASAEVVQQANSVDPAASSQTVAPAQVAALQANATPTPATPPPAAPPITTAKAPTECLPAGLRAVLQELQVRFGPVTLVSTTALHTDNHSPGSTRHKMHSDCKAVDFKVQGDAQAVLAFLKSRPEVGGINVYRNNGVFHIDHNERPVVARR